MNPIGIYLRHLRDAFTTAVELQDFARKWGHSKDALPDGDGHPVFVLPGFMLNDLIMSPLLGVLRDKGYNAYSWDMGVNTGASEETAEKLGQRLQKIYKDNGGKKVSIVGQSLGGIYARELAREYPDMVRAVITLDSPFGIGMKMDGVPGWLVNMITFMTSKKFALTNKGMGERLLTPPPVPTTSIYSKIDPIADWKVCLNPAAPKAENIEVESSHVGSIWSIPVLKVVLDRLSQPEKSWKPHPAGGTETPPKHPRWKPAPGADWRLFGQAPAAPAMKPARRPRPRTAIATT